MAEHRTLKDRLAATVNLTSSADRIAALDAAEQGSAKVAAAVEPRVIEEQRGLGEPAFSSVESAQIAMKVAKIKALKGKPKLQAKLALEIKAIQDAAAARAAAE